MSVKKIAKKEMIEKYSEKEELFERFESLNLEYYENKTFIMFSYESLVLGKLQDSLKKIKDQGFNIEYYSVKPKLSEKALIELYKYHKPAHSNKLEPYGSTIPSIGWSTVRKRFNNLVIGVIVSHKNNPIDRMLKLKGETLPKHCDSNQIRSQAPNIVLTMMHSADDLYSVIRESFLYFNYEELKSLENSTNQREEIYYEMLLLKAELYRPCYKDFNYVINKILFNALEYLTLKQPKNYNRFIIYMNSLIKNIEFYNDSLYKEVIPHIFDEDLKNIISSLISPHVHELQDIDKVLNYLQNCSLCEKGWESLLIESFLCEVYWEGQNDK